MHIKYIILYVERNWFLLKKIFDRQTYPPSYNILVIYFDSGVGRTHCDGRSPPEDEVQLGERKSTYRSLNTIVEIYRPAPQQYAARGGVVKMDRASATKTRKTFLPSAAAAAVRVYTAQTRYRLAWIYYSTVI